MMAEYTERDKYWIWLGSVLEASARTFYYILKEFGSAAGFYDAVQTNSAALDQLSPKVREAARAACSKQHIAELVCELERRGIRAVTRLSSEYPALLTEIEYPPPVLYVLGSLAAIEPAIAIVGTRRCTRRGAKAAHRIAMGLAQSGVTVVSGMALGVDTAAHEGAKAAGGKTVAVLGCGVDVVYPPGSEAIYEYASGNGAVISELPPGAQPYYANFPARNRIITGLCRGCLIVESETEGGTAISAHTAIAQGRDLFAVPGSPEQPMAALPNALIKACARPVLGPEDILLAYDISEPGKHTKDAAGTGAEQLQLDFLQREIYNLLLQGDMGVEEIAAGVRETQRELNVTLTMMELAGLIKRLPGGKYGV